MVVNRKFIDIGERVIRLLTKWTAKPYYIFLHRGVPEYKNPTENELSRIEQDLKATGIPVEDYIVTNTDFKRFVREYGFPNNYHRGPDSGVYYEKLLEHYVAFDLLDLEKNKDTDLLYVDVAADNSPWVKILRHYGITALATDIKRPRQYGKHKFFLVQNATRTAFRDNSISSMSLQCAYEMFLGEDDRKFIREAARVLQPGGRIVISPLYLHTHPCCYSSPEYYGRGHVDPGAKGYIRKDAWRIPASRKYDAGTLKKRVLDLADSQGMKYRVRILRNKKEIHPEIYLHFILEILNHDQKD